MYDVKFADIGEGIHEGVIYTIPIKVGDAVEDGETLFSVETDKVTAEIPSPVTGIIKSIHFSEGDKINVGDVIVIIDDGSEETVSEVVSEGSTSVVGDLEISSQVIPSSGEIVKKEESSKKKVLATPVARKLAKDLNVDINKVVGSGPAGRVMKADIHAANKKEIGKSVEVTLETGNDIRIPMTQIRKVISENMTRSKFTIPHTAMMDELLVDDLVAYRNDVKTIALEKGIKLTYMPFIIKALVIALKEHTLLNGSLEGDEIVVHSRFNIGFAVDTPHGLMVPVIKDADRMSILDLAEAVLDLSTRAQEKKLTLDEISGSTYTITNYGAFGSSFGVPVINYPNAAILGVGKIGQKPIVKDGALAVGYVLPLSMSFDHRFVDGADAGRFMTSLKKLLSNPKLLMLS